MALKTEAHIIKGMQRDLSVSKFNPDYAFECKNIRITARENNTLLSVTNEKGNKEILVLNTQGNALNIEGTLIGSSVLNNYVVLFTTSNVDRIYRLENKTTYFEGVILYTGNLNFNTNSPIESLGVYENEDIQKIYWVDNISQPRVINIVSTEAVRIKWTNNSFDFVQELTLSEKITIQRNDLAGGSFAAGVIQYAFTYYNKYGQESNIFYTTPLNYISYAARGASPEDKVSNSFTIKIEEVDTRFDYIRVYSIHRTSIDATPTVLNVVDLSINSNQILTYVDNGTNGSTVDPTELLYIGGEEVVFGTITQKDNTLFLGNANIKRKLVSTELLNMFRGKSVAYTSKYVSNQGNPTGYYPYKNTLSLSSKIKSFKYLEWYRFGIQFQHNTGKWSEPVFINDVYNQSTKPETSEYGSLSLVQATHQLTSEAINKAVSEGFVRARGVVVYPSLNDREVIAQGVLCPTMFNVADRYSNSPFAMSSWFTRPDMGFDIKANKDKWAGVKDWDNWADSKAAVITNSNVNVTEEGSAATKYIDIVNKGAWAEFRHNSPIPSNYQRGAEIQAITNAPINPYTPNKGSDLNLWAANKGEYFFVDKSILTMHSPDIEFDDTIQNMDSSGLKLRIVGLVSMTSNSSDINIQTSTPANDPTKMGFYKEFVGGENKSIFGLKNLVSGAYWYDKMTDMEKLDDDHGYTEAFMTYAWHRNGSLNNESNPIADGNGNIKTRSAMLDKKKISNLKFSAFTTYLNSPWAALKDNDNLHTGITGVSIFNSNEQSLVRIPAPQYSNLGDLNYYGNVDKVVTVSRVDEPYPVTIQFTDGPKTILLNRKDGYPISVTGVNDASKLAHQLFVGGSFPIHFVKRSDGVQLTRVPNGTDPVRIKYKSTPHAVFAFNYSKDGKNQIILPTFDEYIYDNIVPTIIKANAISNPSTNSHFFWNTDAKNAEAGSSTIIHDNIFQDSIRIPDTSAQGNIYGLLWLAELYNDKVENRFGGQTEEAFENNEWVSAGEPVSLISGYNSNNAPIPLSTATLYYSEGDTFMQRYDCLKTYPYTLEDQNSVTEILSFMCETRVNIDGRYDRNRGQISNLTTTPENFNKINKVYSQKNNFFTYRGINHSKFNLNYFPNTITWTKEKQLGSVIDTWTNITMASTLDLDGDKGEVVSLNTFNNEIFCFQKQGLSNILFNSRVQIPASDGLPIEISNGMKVSGKRYISNTIGCNNKWSIAESPSGLYFIDNLTNSIYLFNGQISSISDKLGFRQWVGENNSQSLWDPINYNNFRTFYDKNNDDVYFVNKDQCLCYSELIEQFTSFMSYEKVPAMFNITSEFYAIKGGKIWKQFEGDYNRFFNVIQPFYVDIVSNSEEPYDKIFNTVEFRGDSWDSSNNLILTSPFSTLDVYNEYQHGTSNLVDIINKSSTIKRKFRVWRANIPRDNSNKRDRIRNTWAHIKLTGANDNINRVELHDMIVHYFV